MIGPHADPVPLDATVVEQIRKGDYEQLKVEYSTEAGERIPALVP